MAGLIIIVLWLGCCLSASRSRWSCMIIYYFAICYQISYWLKEIASKVCAFSTVRVWVIWMLSNVLCNIFTGKRETSNSQSEHGSSHPCWYWSVYHCVCGEFATYTLLNTTWLTAGIYVGALNDYFMRLDIIEYVHVGVGIAVSDVTCYLYCMLFKLLCGSFGFYHRLQRFK